MARASVELIVEAAKAVNPLRKVEQHSKKVDQALKRSQKSARDVEAAFQRMGRTGIRSFRDLEVNAARLGKRMGGLRAAAAKVVVGFTAFKAGQAAIGRIESVRRLNRLGGAYGEVADLQNAATKAAETFGLSQTEANQQFSQIYARLRPVGVTLKDIESTFVGFNTVARLSGASSVEASNAFTQLAQALGSGALRGDEFNSISEQVPGILTAISQETGVAQGNLRKFAAEGKITSDIVMRALKRIEKEGAGGLKDAMNGPAQAFKDFKNIADNALVALGEDSIPQVIRLIKQMGDAINGLMPIISAVGSFAGTVLGGIADIIDRIRDPKKLQAEAQAFFDKGQGKRPMANLPADLKQTEAPFFATPAAAVPSGAAGADGTGKKRVDISEKLLALNKELFESTEPLSELEKISLGYQIEKQEILDRNLLPREEEVALLKAAAGFEQDLIGYRERQMELQEDAIKKSAEAFDAQMKQQEDLRQALLEADPGFKMKQRLEELLDVQNQVAAGATAIGNAFSNSLKAVVDGSKSADQALADMMASVAEHFLDMAAKIIAQQLAMILYGTILKALGFPMGGGAQASSLNSQSLFNTDLGLPAMGDLPSGFKFAQGGYVSGPTNALIGEGGEPEYVIPESKMRESMARYSRGARGGSVIPESGEGGTTGEGGGTAVATQLDVRFNVERINNVDYVTAEEFQVGMQRAATQGAQRGQQLALSRLQQSPGTRRRLGL
jgi:tape measure domain-containing protein